MIGSAHWPRPYRSGPAGSWPENPVARVWHETDIPTTASIRPLGAVARLSWNNRVAPRAGLEPAAYCLGGTTAPAVCRAATTHVPRKRNSQRQLLPERSSSVARSARSSGAPFADRRSAGRRAHAGHVPVGFRRHCAAGHCHPGPRQAVLQSLVRVSLERVKP
jgi:hypothetical protein